jgi:hypothetical protein
MRARKRSAKDRPFPPRAAIGGHSYRTIGGIVRQEQQTGTVRAASRFSPQTKQTREKNDDAPETDFDRCFPHEPLQEQTKAAAGKTLPRAGPALMRLSRRRQDAATVPPFGCTTWPLM